MFKKMLAVLAACLMLGTEAYAAEDAADGTAAASETESTDEAGDDETNGIPPVEKGAGNTLVFGDRLIPADARKLDLSGMDLKDYDTETLFKSMPKLESVRLIGCGLTNDGYAALQDKFPGIRMIWDIKLSRRSIRTDSVGYSSFRGGALDQWMTDDDAKYLKYCRDMVAVDLGHNPVHDLSFLQYMPNLKILIMVDNRGLTDLSYLKYVPQLTYLEIFVNRVSDLSVFQYLHQMQDLNISYNPISSTEYLKDFPKLERLWMECTRVPYSEFQALGEIYPDVKRVYYGSGSVDQGWRVGSHYAAMRDIVKYNAENDIYYRDFVREYEEK